MSRKKNRTTICPEGWYYVLAVVFVFSVGVVREANLVLLVAALLCGPLLFGWRLAKRTLRDLGVRRRVPRAVCAGDLLVVALDVTNRRGKLPSWAVVVEDQLVREDDRSGERPVKPRAFLDYIPAGKTRRQTYRGRIARRGRYLLGPMQVWTRFPFGFFRRSLFVGESRTLTVLPRMGKLKPGWTSRQYEAFEGARRPQMRQSRGMGEFYGVRQWRAGESRRWIHWRSSARHDSLVVCQFEKQREMDVAVLVDLWQPEAPAVEHLENVELAASFAATVVADVCRQGGSNLLFAVASEAPNCLAGPVSTPLLQESMERLAVAEASSENLLPKLLKEVAPRLGPDTDVIVVTTRSIGDQLRDIENNSRRSSRRFRIVNTADPKLAQIFRAD
jgi:uncharacterized protein (DUF58 family)